MTKIVPYLHIEQETSSKLTLVSAERHLVILITSLVVSAPNFLIGMLLLSQETWMMGAAFMLFSVIILAIVLLSVPIYAELIIDSYARQISLNLTYWIGLGSLESVRESKWFFTEITDVKFSKQGWKKYLELEADGKKAAIFNFGNNSKDAQRSYDLLQTWIKGLRPDSIEASTALKETAAEKQPQNALKSAEKMLYYFGGFSLFAGVMGLFTESMINTSVSTATLLNIATGFIYLACGFGTRRKFELALWIAIVVALAERLYWFILSGTLRGDGTWSSWMTWIFAFLVVSSLWRAIQSIRTMDENPVYEPLP